MKTITYIMMGLFLLSVAFAEISVDSVSPEDGATSQANVSFQCHAVSNETLSTVNLIINGSVVDSRAVSTMEETVEFNQSLAGGIYSWHCQANNSIEVNESANFTLTIDDTSPAISNISTENGRFNVPVHFITNELSNHTVEYWAVPETNFSVVSTIPQLSHDFQLEGLRPATVYYFIITACDSVGNCAVSNLSNFTTLEPIIEETPTPSGGGSSSSGGGSSFSVNGKDAWKVLEYEGKEYMQVINKIYANKPHAIKLSNPAFDVREIEIVTKKDVFAGGVLINQLTKAPKGSLLAFEIVSNLQESNINKIKITFRIPKTASEVFVEHEHEGKKDTYQVELKEETAQYRYYSVEVPSFSLFMVKSGELQETEDDQKEVDIVPIEMPLVEDSIELPEEDSTIEESVSNKEKEQEVKRANMVKILITIVSVIIIIGILGYLVWLGMKEEKPPVEPITV